MIHTDKEFENEAIVFFRKEGKYLNEDYSFDIESMALVYVKNNNDFKYKDVVDAGVLVRCLEDSDYIKFEEKKNNRRYHSLTKKGIEFIHESTKHER